MRTALTTSAFALAVSLLLASSTASAQFGSPGRPVNLLVNSEAEQGLSGWQANGIGVAAYGQDRRLPTAAYAGRLQRGPRLFAAGRESGTLSQTVSLAALAPAIDAGEQGLFFGGLLGGTGARRGSVRLSLQLLASDGTELGAYTTGAPTAKDRDWETRLISCGRGIQGLPVGTRSARLTLTATGPQESTGIGFADALYVETQPRAVPQQRLPPTEAANCHRAGPPVSASSFWKLIVAHPSRRRRCSRSLRFAVRPDWVERVERLTIAAGRTRRSVSPTARRRSITLPRSRRTLRVKLRVRLFDGTVLRGRIRYKGCRARVRG